MISNSAKPTRYPGGRRPGGRRRWLCLLACALALTTGCVQRRLTVRSNPPGALVYVDNNEIGMTPVSVDFTYYGARQIRLVKDGYETLKDQVRISAPWYQYVPIDFVVENLVPVEIEDHRHLTYQLEPQLVAPNDQLLNRAEELRRGNPGMPMGEVLPAPRPEDLPPPPGPRLQP
jgi:hypothetical protein